MPNFSLKNKNKKKLFSTFLFFMIISMFFNINIETAGANATSDAMDCMSRCSVYPTGSGSSKQMRQMWDTCMNDCYKEKGIVTEPLVSNKLTSLQFLGVAATLAGFLIIAGYSFILLAVLLAVRYAILAVLFILAPLAFVFWAFPATKKLWTKWWEEFIKWAFIGVSSAFFIYLATSVLEGAKKANAGSVGVNNLFVTFIFLIVGYKLTRSSAPKITGAAIGLATGAAGYAMGAVKFGAKATGLAGLAQRGTQAAQRGLTKYGEKMGLVAPGTANLMRQKQQQEYESEKRATTWSAQQRKDIATGPAVTARQRNDRIEAAKQIALKGELGSLTQTERDSVMGYATSHGVSAGTLAKGDYRAAEYDKGKIDKIMTARGVTDVVAKQIARQEQLQQLLPSMTEEQHRNIDDTDITPGLLTSRAMSTKVARSLRTASAAHLSRVGNTTTHVMDPILAGEFNTQIAAANGAGNTSEANRLKDIRNELQNIL